MAQQINTSSAAGCNHCQGSGKVDGKGCITGAPVKLNCPYCGGTGKEGLRTK